MTTTKDPKDTDISGVGSESLISRVTRMLAQEAYHYCADCHTHCCQTILTVEAFKEALRENIALAEAARFALIVLHDLPPTELSEEMAIGKLNAALGIAPKPATNTAKRVQPSPIR